MSALLTIWWVWMAVGLLLGIIEVLVPGFIFLGFGIAIARWFRSARRRIRSPSTCSA